MKAPIIGVVFAVVLAALPLTARAGDEPSRHEWGKHGDEALIEGDIVLESTDGTRKVAMLLGAPLGNETVEGIDVGLFVLQASNPERLKAGAEGPTHLFNVTFKAGDGSRLIKEALCTVVVEGAGESQRVVMRSRESHHEAFARLEEEGEYRIRVEFLTADRKGETGSYPFVYKRNAPLQHCGSHPEP